MAGQSPTTEDSTTAPTTTEPSTTAPTTTEASTTAPTTTESCTTVPTTTEASTTAPTTTETSTTAPTTTEASTTVPSTTEASTTAPSTTESSTTVPKTTEASTTAPTTTETSTIAPTTTEASTTAPSTTEASTTAPSTTESSTTVATTTEASTTVPTTTESSTIAPTTNESSTTAQTTTKSSTTLLTNTEASTTTEVLTSDQTTSQATTTVVLPTEIAPPNPVTPTPNDGRPVSCFFPFQATVRKSSSSTLTFVEDLYVLTIDDTVGRQSLSRTNSVFVEAPRYVDAAFNIPETSYIYLINGMRIYEFNSNKGFVRKFWVTGGTQSFPEEPRAAYAVSANEIYIIGVSQVWRFDLTSRRSISGSFQLISQRYPGIPNGINAALYYNTTTAYFFDGFDYLTYDFTSQSVLANSYSDTAAAFLKGDCIM